jgi:hypothetical protein
MSAEDHTKRVAKVLRLLGHNRRPIEAAAE